MDKILSKLPVILVVDDDEDMLVLMQGTLERQGFYPIFSPNAKNIMAIITQQQPALVLLDINMEAVNGADICKEIKQNPVTAKILVVMYSANDNIHEVTKDCGADAFLSKPFQREKLQAVLQQIFPAGI